MNSIINFLIKKNNTTNFWVKRGLLLMIIAFIANHLMEIDNFPLSASYKFPLFSILVSFITGSIVLLISDLNFNYFKKKYFREEINIRLLFRFLTSTFGYITILYIPSFYFVVWLQNGDFRFYYLITGLSITLLISTLALIFLYGQKVYNLHKLKIPGGKLVVQKGNNKRLITISEISYFYSEHKIVYIVLLNGQKISTYFTLNEIENKISKHLFLRANRQTLVHPLSIKEIKSIENSKLLVTLHPTIPDKQITQIVISRYKKKAFNEWFKHEQE